MSLFLLLTTLRAIIDHFEKFINHFEKNTLLFLTTLRAIFDHFEKFVVLLFLTTLREENISLSYNLKLHQ